MPKNKIKFLKNKLRLSCLLIFICFLFLISFNCPFNFSACSSFQIVHAKSNYTNYYYAKVESEKTYLYKSTLSLGLENAYFEIPNSYFVLLISNIDNLFYKVQYRDVVGFVLKEDVTPISETPTTPYLENISFRVFSSDGINLFATPTNENSQVLTQVELLKDIDYYGLLQGQELIENRGNDWIYCKYTSENNTYYGYLYKGLCDDISPITLNTETFTPIENPFEDNDNSYMYSLLNLSSFAKIIIILLLLVPCIFIVFLMFKPFEIEKNKLKNKLTKTKPSLNKIQQIIDDEPL